MELQTRVPDTLAGRRDPRQAQESQYGRSMDDANQMQF
jgi:hypothetical protein